MLIIQIYLLEREMGKVTEHFKFFSKVDGVVPPFRLLA